VLDDLYKGAFDWPITLMMADHSLVDTGAGIKGGIGAGFLDYRGRRVGLGKGPQGM